jgi:hypothetical protein
MSCKLYSYGLEAGNYLYLIQDMTYSLLSGLVISLTPGNEALSADLPPSDFFNAFMICKLLGQVVLFMVFQWAALYLLSTESWYSQYIPGKSLNAYAHIHASVVALPFNVPRLFHAQILKFTQTFIYAYMHVFFGIL